MTPTPEDFGGDAPRPLTRKESIAKVRAEKAARNECRECSNPVKIKSNGQPARVCEEHAAADRKRKT